jgi:hypothetical protein
MVFFLEADIKLLEELHYSSSFFFFIFIFNNVDGMNSDIGERRATSGRKRKRISTV